ncbi:RNase P subunit p30-domain-containing protein [Apiospora hydei]|uniref:RNase P subunit p30-domain-containing protein n=1 Tax=Apiospora hydei TaxID=1337664 RepID=A0ABR1VTZ5_9PEZI
MLYDLNIAWLPSTTQSELTQTLKFSASLGYNAVALNHLIENVPPQPKNPLPASPPRRRSRNPPKPRPEATATTTKAKMRNKNKARRRTIPRSLPSPPLYDIVAVRPTTEKEFSHACQEVRIEVASLISLDLTQRFPFHFRPKPCMAAVSRGLRFEVCYGQTLRAGASSDPRTRATWIGNLMELVRATRGRGIVISSEARRVTELRGPADVVNLLAVWGLAADKGMEGLGVNARGVVVNEGINRRGYRGVVDIVQVAARDDEEGDKMEGVETAGEAQKGKAAAAGGNGKKRKGGANEGRGSGNGNAPPADGTMSKRQAKKLKKLAMEESGATTPEENKS